MHSILVLVSTLLGVTASATAVPTSPQSENTDFEILKYRNWDLRFFAPGCNPNTTSIELSLLHRSGRAPRDCVSLLTELGPDGKPVDVTQIDTVSWKSPSQTSHHDLCLYQTADCEGGSDREVRNGWEVCFEYQGWLGYRVVKAGDSC